MAFTRQHYVAVVKMLRPPRTGESALDYRRSLISGFGAMFSADNERFSLERFGAAIDKADEEEHQRYLVAARGEGPA